MEDEIYIVDIESEIDNIDILNNYIGIYSEDTI